MVSRAQSPSPVRHCHAGSGTGLRTPPGTAKSDNRLSAEGRTRVNVRARFALCNETAGSAHDSLPATRVKARPGPIVGMAAPSRGFSQLGLDLFLDRPVLRGFCPARHGSQRLGVADHHAAMVLELNGVNAGRTRT